MKRLLAVAGAVALLAWTGLGLFAWTSAARRVTVVLAEEEGASRSAEASALAEEMGALHADLRALAEAMAANAEVLEEHLARQDERAAAIEGQVSALREEAGAGRASAPTLAAIPRAEPEPAVEPEQTAPASVAPPPASSEPASATPARRSFLAFKLPSDDFRFDERRSWTVLPSLSRVGFDAKSTLHDFSGTTSAVAGELAVDLSRPERDPHLTLRVEAAKLATGNGSRDEEMREYLAVREHPVLGFELSAFEPAAIDAKARTFSGRARGRMTVRGVTRDVAMDLRVSIDDARRLCVEGSMPLDLEQYEVPVPSKLGLISMEKHVEVWISLRLRVDPRTDG